MKQLKDFLAFLHAKDTIIQVGTHNKVLAVSGKDKLDEFLPKNEEKCLYFTGNVDKSKGYNRCSDGDIKNKKYVYFDFDIRKEQKDITDDEIKKMGKEFGEKLDKNGYDWSAITFTGNGLHVYFIGDSVKINIQDYSFGYDCIRQEIEKIVGINADESCSNVSRIARIPCSFNNKKTKKLVEFIEFRRKKSFLLQSILTLGADEKERITKIKAEEEALREYKSFEELHSSDELFNAINQIPIEQEISKDYSWRFDGKNFWESDGSRASSSFVGETKPNVLIIRGSRWFTKINHKGAGTYLYRREMNRMSPEETVNYFLKNYPELEKHVVKPDTKPIDKTKRYTWGTTDLNNTFALIKPTTYTVLVGESGDGKTTFAYFQAIQNVKLGHKVLYISLEMDTEELFDNIARSYSGITIEEEFNQITPDVKEKAYERKKKELQDMKGLITLGFRKGNSVDISAIKKVILENKADIVYIDNLDLINVKGQSEEQGRQREISRSVMSLSSELQTPIVLLHHYRKKSSTSKSAKRSMDDIGGNRKITHDADRIVHIVRNYDKDATVEERASLVLFLDKARGYNKAFKIVYFYRGEFYDKYPESKEKTISNNVFNYKN